MEGDLVVCGEEEAGGSRVAGSEDDLSRCIPSTSTRTTTTTTPRITTTMVSKSTGLLLGSSSHCLIVISLELTLVFTELRTRVLFFAD